MNDNEIREIDERQVEVLRKDRWRRRELTRQSSQTLPAKRTFADILAKNEENTVVEKAPKLEFLAMHHEMPSLCESFTASFRDAILKTQKEALPTLTAHDFPLNYYVSEDAADSGLGPSHIEDWQSLSVLLPKNVVEACSFFKSNTQLLMGPAATATAKKSPTKNNSLCIDRRISASANEACRTCYRVRRKIHPPIWAQTANSKQVLCDCTANQDHLQFSFAPTTSTTRHQLRARELSIVGLPVYSHKRQLIESVVEGVAAISRGEGCEDLVIAMRCLIEDGLLPTTTAWQMIKTVTSKGPATKDVHSIVRQLDECQKSDLAKVEIFFEELIRENSLDCWLCYIVLKEKALKNLYMCDSFLVAASGEYRTLLWRMVDSLALLPVIEARTSTNSKSDVVVWQKWGGAARLAADSRVPKSSSVPARLVAKTRQPSRIPLSTSRTSIISSASSYSASSASATTFRIAKAIRSFRIEQFAVESGERFRVLSTRHGMSRVFRITHDVTRLRNGLIPVENLSFII
ncbi:unnamed protein product [Caenorhabditis angaria]|uniref:RUN domain-containing protein n=1 Tax=Caenorhabditis angaria TaxID=860376 RepID=A0A9P1MUC1_9PELO|nr:unnamed protein product [Caenorhabditis angaria]